MDQKFIVRLVMCLIACALCASGSVFADGGSFPAYEIVEATYSKYVIDYSVDQDTHVVIWDEEDVDRSAGTKYRLAETTDYIAPGRSPYVASLVVQLPREHSWEGFALPPTAPYIAMVIQEESSRDIPQDQVSLLKILLGTVAECNCWPRPGEVTMMFNHNDPSLYQWQPFSIDGYPGVELVYYECGSPIPGLGSIENLPCNDVYSYLLNMRQGEWPDTGAWCKITCVGVPQGTREMFLDSVHVERREEP